MRKVFIIFTLFLSLLPSLLWYGVTPAQAATSKHVHLIAAPTKVTQTDEETSLGILSATSFGLYGRHLHPRTTYTITADFNIGGACTGGWAVLGNTLATTDGEFTIKTDRHGNFNTAIVAIDCLPQEYDIEATDPAGTHYEAEVWVVS